MLCWERRLKCWKKSLRALPRGRKRARRLRRRGRRREVVIVERRRILRICALDSQAFASNVSWSMILKLGESIEDVRIPEEQLLMLTQGEAPSALTALNRSPRTSPLWLQEDQIEVLGITDWQNVKDKSAWNERRCEADNSVVGRILAQEILKMTSAAGRIQPGKQLTRKQQCMNPDTKHDQSSKTAYRNRRNEFIAGWPRSMIPEASWTAHHANGPSPGPNMPSTKNAVPSTDTPSS